MACEPTTDLDDQGAAGDRLGPPADGGRGMDSLASGANQPAAPSADPSADEIERIVRSRHNKPYRVLGLQPARGGQWSSCRTPDDGVGLDEAPVFLDAVNDIQGAHH
jgi:hypothetical protein